MMTRWQKNQYGTALIEMAFMFPILLLLILGAVELVRYILVLQKVDKSAYALADAITQSTPANTGIVAGLTETQINDILALYPDLLSPFDEEGSPAVRVTSFRNEGGTVRTKWSLTRGGDPGVPDAPVGMNLNENLINVRVSYIYEPFLSELLQGLGFNIVPTTLVREAYLHPRNGDLICMPPNIATLYSECWPASVVNGISRCYEYIGGNPCGIYYELDGSFSFDNAPCDGSSGSPPAGWNFC